MKASEAIRTAISDGWYTGWIGVRDTPRNDYNMCCALEKQGRARHEEMACDRASRRIHRELMGFVTLRSLFAKETCWEQIDSPFDKNSMWRAKALEWFENIAAQLEAEGD